MLFRGLLLSPDPPRALPQHDAGRLGPRIQRLLLYLITKFTIALTKELNPSLPSHARASTRTSELRDLGLDYSTCVDKVRRGT